MATHEILLGDLISFQHVLNGLKPFKDKATELVKPFKVGRVPK
jgi:hypothetical protein